MQDEIQSLKEKIELSSLENSNGYLESDQMEALKTQIEESTAAVSNLTMQIAALREACGRLEDEKAQIQEELEDKSHQIAQFETTRQSENAKMQDEVVSLKEKMSQDEKAFKSKISVMESRVGGESEKLKYLRVENESLSQQKQFFEKMASDASAHSEEIEAKINDQMNTITSLNAQIMELKQELEISKMTVDSEDRRMVVAGSEGGVKSQKWKERYRAMVDQHERDAIRIEELTQLHQHVHKDVMNKMQELSGYRQKLGEERRLAQQQLTAESQKWSARVLDLQGQLAKASRTGGDSPATTTLSQLREKLTESKTKLSKLREENNELRTSCRKLVVAEKVCQQIIVGLEAQIEELKSDHLTPRVSSQHRIQQAPATSKPVANAAHISKSETPNTPLGSAIKTETEESPESSSAPVRSQVPGYKRSRGTSSSQSPSKKAKKEEPENNAVPEMRSQETDGQNQKKVCVCLSGFGFDSEKSDLTEAIAKLSGTVCDAEFEDRITHVISPIGRHTLKTLAAALRGVWLLTPDWIVESAKAGYFLPEERFGKNNQTDLRKKRFCGSGSF
eukprot:TRINITY_DN2013_c0_g1_i1.p1 TRINITY_DN2013_c0_g1~~TRINITY_DN2013_c0_g1_i1.p1  ORF type:complete len:588 (+),score=212.27 TRINITY_DN2013_c0_g1_i1:70-1764(+)